MKITKTQLKRLIKEELGRVLNESGGIRDLDLSSDGYPRYYEFRISDTQKDQIIGLLGLAGDDPLLASINAGKVTPTEHKRIVRAILHTPEGQALADREDLLRNLEDAADYVVERPPEVQAKRSARNKARWGSGDDPAASFGRAGLGYSSSGDSGDR